MKSDYLSSAESTDTGRKRRHNEDSVLQVPAWGLYCVADGMGGVLGGDIASQAVVDSLRRAFAAEPPETYSFEAVLGALRQAIDDASCWIKARADDMGVVGTGTTVVMLLFDLARPQRAVALHAGDSRLYRCRGGRLDQITVDHSVAAAAGLKNDKALPAMFRGVVTRAVGLDRVVQLEMTAVDVEGGDLFLLCSDGLTKMVADPGINSLLAPAAAGGDLAAVARACVDAANAAGGDDNVSAVLIRTAASLPAAQPTSDDTLPGTPPPGRAPAPVTAATATQATLPFDAPPRRAREERVSDAAHASGVTPTGFTPAGDAPTPDTDDFQKTPPDLDAPAAPPADVAPPPPAPAPPPPAPLADTPAAPPVPPPPAPVPPPASPRWITPVVVLLVVVAGVVAVLNQQRSQPAAAEPAPDAAAAAVAAGDPPPPPPAPAPAAPPAPGEVDGLAVHQEIRRGLDDNQWDAFLARLPASPEARPALCRMLFDALDQYAGEMNQSAAAMQTGLLATVTWVQAQTGRRDERPASALLALRQQAELLLGWSRQARDGVLEVDADTLRKGPIAWVGQIEAAQDDLCCALYDTVRQVNTAAAPWGTVADDGQKQRVYEVAALRWRILNVRAKYRESIRDWRRNEGRADLLRIFSLIDQAFPRHG